MKKITLSIVLFTFFMFGLQAQTIVSTSPQNKKAILEEFTGTSCPNCPAGHTAAASILAANPHNVFIVAYHPNNSSYTSNDIMARAYPAAFYDATFLSSRYMPSAMINRRVWGGDRIQGRTSWAADVSTIIAEASPLNVGVSSVYNSSTKMLSVTVEVYFTADVSNTLNIYCELTEDGIVATQSGGTSPYTHNHVFRESFVAQWGDNISGPQTLGTTKSFTFTFDNSTENYDMTKAEVVAFVRNADDEEIISGNGALVGEATPLSVNDNISNNNTLKIYPNPATQNATMDLSIEKKSKVEYSIVNITGQLIYTEDLGQINAGNYSIPVNESVLNTSGIYFVKVLVDNKQIVEKLIIN